MMSPDTPLSVHAAAKYLGVSIRTLHEWEKRNHLVPAFRTLGGHRRYLVRQLEEVRSGAR